MDEGRGRRRRGERPEALLWLLVRAAHRRPSAAVHVPIIPGWRASLILMPYPSSWPLIASAAAKSRRALASARDWSRCASCSFVSLGIGGAA